MSSDRSDSVLCLCSIVLLMMCSCTTISGGESKPYLSLFWEQDSCWAEGSWVCFSEEHGREGLLWRSWGLWTTFYSSVPYLPITPCSFIARTERNLPFPDSFHYLLSLRGCLPGGRKDLMHLQLSPEEMKCASQGWCAYRLPTGRGVLLSLQLQKVKNEENQCSSRYKPNVSQGL